MATLRSVGIPPDWFSLDGSGVRDQLVLDQKITRWGFRIWVTYDRERGCETGTRKFDTESDACEYVLERMLEQQAFHSEIRGPDDVYSFVRYVRLKSEKKGRRELAEALDNALAAGSSGLEVLGALRQVMRENADVIDEVLRHGWSRKRTEEVLRFIDRVWRGVPNLSH